MMERSQCPPRLSRQPFFSFRPSSISGFVYSEQSIRFRTTQPIYPTGILRPAYDHHPMPQRRRVRSLQRRSFLQPLPTAKSRGSRPVLPFEGQASASLVHRRLPRQPPRHRGCNDQTTLAGSMDASRRTLHGSGAPLPMPQHQAPGRSRKDLAARRVFRPPQASPAKFRPSASAGRRPHRQSVGIQTSLT